jgi:hypothetical protein
VDRVGGGGSGGYGEGEEEGRTEAARDKREKSRNQRVN